MILHFTYFALTIANLVSANPILVERSGGSPCHTKKYGDLESLSGTCQTSSSCKKYISLPEDTSSGANCGKLPVRPIPKHR